MGSPADRLASNQPCLELGVYLFVYEYEAEHGAAHAPLITALFKQNHLEQGVQNARQKVWSVLQMVSHDLH